MAEAGYFRRRNKVPGTMPPAPFRKPVFFNPLKPRAKRLVEMALKAARAGSAEGTKLNTTCWNAVYKCAEMAGAITARASTLMQATTASNNFTAFVPAGSTHIRNQQEWNDIAPGCFVALLGAPFSSPMSQSDDGRLLSHAMISLGNGQMAGSNNGVIGFAGNWTTLALDQRHSWANDLLIYEGRTYKVLARDIESEDRAICVIQ
jgi:hypothetical protein